MKDLTDEQWRQKLTSEQYKVLCQKGTEAPFTGKFVDHYKEGVYVCAACGSILFSSENKFDSGTGWPSFSDVAKKGNVELHEDGSHEMRRIEVTCAKCGSHLGHLFNEPTAPRLRGPSGPKWTGNRYCINSCSLGFKPK